MQATDPKQARKCKAHKRSGAGCGNPPMAGGVVCRMHGGKAPQVLAKAAWRQWQAFLDVADPDRVMAEAACIAFSNFQELLDADGRMRPMKDWPEWAARAVKKVETVTGNVDKGDGKLDQVLRIEFWDKPRKVENLMRHHGKLVDKVDHTVTLDISERLLAARKRMNAVNG